MSRFSALALALALPAVASAQDAANGKELYMQHCAFCHGLEAKGGGPLAGGLIVQPKDLTLLSRENNGVFPLVRAVMRVDGREALVSHGSPMPIYGPYFEGDRSVAMRTEAGQPMLMSVPVADITAYMIEIQQ